MHIIPPIPTLFSYFLRDLQSAIPVEVSLE